MEYATQMEAARKGILTPQMEAVAGKENLEPAQLMQWMAEGKVIIPANKQHVCLEPEGIGSMLRTKINVNLGVSKDCQSYEMEMEKVNEAVRMGAHAIMDLSSSGETGTFRRMLTGQCPAVIGTVPVYDAVLHYNKDLKEITAREFIQVVRLHAQEGVDFMTIHCGLTRKSARLVKENGRLTNIVSRGGSLVFAWMEMTGQENPFYEYYDEILDICRQYDVTMSLGDACRPGCIQDASDICQIDELVTLGELTRRAWEKDRIKKALLDKGRLLFGSYSLKKTGIEDITKAVGIAQGSFYQFFPSKEALYFAIVEQEESGIKKKILEDMMTSSNSPKDCLKKMLIRSMKLIQESPILLQLYQDNTLLLLSRKLPEEDLERHFKNDFTDLSPFIARWQADGILKQEDPEIIAGLLRSLFLLTLHKTEIGEGIYDRVLALLVELVGDGLVKKEA